MIEKERFLKQASGNLYSTDSKAYHWALEQLRDHLVAIGFTVNKKHAGEATLRVYPAWPIRYPLLNPRFWPTAVKLDKMLDTESLVMEVLSRSNDAGIERQLATFTSTRACAFSAQPFISPKYYRNYGAFILPLRFMGEPGKQEIDFAALKVPLTEIRNLLSLGSPGQTKGAQTKSARQAETAVNRALNGITADDVRTALRDLDKGVQHEFGESTGYDLLEDGKRYPPKAVVGLACRRLLGRALGPYDFKGGLESRCFKVLAKLDFEVVPKVAVTSSTVWALCANPSRYRIEEAVTDLVTDWWTTGGRKIRQGDQLVIWKTAGRDGHRGIVAFGEVTGDPELRTDSDNPFWIDPSDGRTRAQRVPVRYIRTASLPAWLGSGLDALLGSLSVARAKGGTAFRVSTEDWERLISALGPLPATGSVTEEIDAPEISSDQRRGGAGQGRGLNAEERRVVELHAMEAAEQYYRAEGWEVRDVSGRLCYDLHCSRKEDELHVEVKGTMSAGTSVLVTRREVNHIRTCDCHVLFVVSGIRLERLPEKTPKPSGGSHVICRPLRLSEHRLEPVSFELFLEGQQTSAAQLEPIGSSSDLP